MIGAKKCKPFILEVMIYSPKSGYKADVVVERGCTADNSSVWKFVFDLYKKNAAGTFDQLIHVSYRGLTPAENARLFGAATAVTHRAAWYPRRDPWTSTTSSRR